MIDFRYHVVSLVSVFIALAVGIVLGAGPLRGQIADQLSARVDQLAEEKRQLRSDKDIAEAGVKNRDAFATQVTPLLVTGRLSGRHVVLVSLPGAQNELVDPLTTALKAAGAEVTGRVEIKTTWSAPDRSQARATVVREWSKVLTAPAQQATRSSGSGTPRPSAGAKNATPSRGGTDIRADLQDLLARCLVTANPLETGDPDPVGGQVLNAFSQQGLVAVREKVTGRADLAVVLAPPVATDPVAPSPSPSGADPVRDWVDLSLTLDRAGGGVVLFGPASSALDGGALAVLRAQKQDTRQVSTVDTAGSPMGDVTTIHALSEQVRGDGNAYGFGRGAAAVMPAVSAAEQVAS